MGLCAQEMPPFGFRVRHVDLVRSKKQMVGIDAERIVAAMANFQAFGGLAVNDDPHRSMCMKRTLPPLCAGRR
jgi:hypothetical protein